MDEGKAPGYPLGYGQYGSHKPVRVVGNDDGGDEEDASSSDVGPSGNVDEGGKGIPLYGRASKIVLGGKMNCGD